MTHPPAGPSNPTPPPGPKYGQTLTMPTPYDPQPPPPAPKPTPGWAVACLIAAAVLAFGALALADVVLVPLAMRGPR